MKVEHIVNEIQSYLKNRLQHVKRTEHSLQPRMALEYQPKGKRDIDRPRTRWRDQLHFQGSVFTGQDTGVLHLFTFMMKMI
jgi:hypothetical protein